MSLNGKKTERVLMRVSEDMAREVRALAELECRTIQDQFRMLIICGLQQMKAGGGNGTSAGMRAPMSTRVARSTFAEEQAKELPSTSVSSRQLPLAGCVGPVAARKRRAS